MPKTLGNANSFESLKNVVFFYEKSQTFQITRQENDAGGAKPHRLRKKHRRAEGPLGKRKSLEIDLFNHGFLVYSILLSSMCNSMKQPELHTNKDQ